MAWVLEEIKNRCFAAKYGAELSDTKHFDPYGFACIIEDVGGGVALLHNATGSVRIADRVGLEDQLLALGFCEVRWIRVQRHLLDTKKMETPD